MGDYTEHLISMAGGDGELDLDAIQARADAATTGPWKAENLERDHGHKGIFWVSVDHQHQIKTVAEVDANDDGIEALWRMADAEFIAAARTDVPALLALVREQQARIERVREFHHPFTHHFMSPPAGSLEVCYSCRESYPCPTIAALTATDQP